nr:hypothetical protein [Tanacetum cinerariifolium]
HFRKNASSVSKLCFVCGSGTHLVKDFPTGKPKVTPVPTGKPKVTLVSTGKPKVTRVPTGKPKVTPVPTGKLQASTLVPTGGPNRPFPIPTDRGYSSSVISGWWSCTASPMPYLINPTSSYFQNYSPYVPTMYSHHMKNGRAICATAVKPSVGCSWKSHRKCFHWVPKNNGGSHTSTWTKLSDPQGRPKP